MINPISYKNYNFWELFHVINKESEIKDENEQLIAKIY